MWITIIFILIYKNKINYIIITLESGENLS